jgi:UDP-glucose 4-epimerase
MKKVIIFGGTGYLGTNLALRLSEQFKVTITGRRDVAPSLKILLSNKKVHIEKLEIRNLREAYSLIDQNDCIVYAVPNIQPHQIRPVFHSDLLRIIRPTEKIFEYAGRSTKQLIFLSSGGSVYGLGSFRPHSEDSHPRPIDQYGRFKLRLERSLIRLNSSFHSTNVILRIANPYGGTFGDYFKQGFVNSVVRNIKSKKQVEIWGDGNQIRDFINVDDVVKLVFLILSKEDSTGIFNCGTGKGYSLRQVIEISEEILNSKINIKFYNSYIEKIESNILDVSKSKNCFNWNPDHDLRKNLFKLLPFN